MWDSIQKNATVKRRRGRRTPGARRRSGYSASGVGRPASSGLGCGVCCFLFQVEAEEEPEDGDDTGDDKHGGEAEGVY